MAPSHCWRPWSLRSSHFIPTVPFFTSAVMKWGILSFKPHFAIALKNWLHLQVWELGHCPNCKATGLNREELFLRHVTQIAHRVKAIGPKTIPIIWDDMIRTTDPQLLKGGVSLLHLALFCNWRSFSVRKICWDGNCCHKCLIITAFMSSFNCREWFERVCWDHGLVLWGNPQLPSRFFQILSFSWLNPSLIVFLT